MQRISRKISFHDVITSSNLDTAGYATITNTGSLGAFTGATVPALASATYDIDITVDGTLTPVAVALLNTDSWTSIAAKIQAALRALTSSTETVTISSGKIKVTSASVGAASTIDIAAGTTGSGGGDLLAAINAIGATYVVSLDTPVDGTEGTISIQVTNSIPSDDFSFIAQVRTTLGATKYGCKQVYNKTTGVLTLTDAGSFNFVVGDTIDVIGSFVS